MLVTGKNVYAEGGARERAIWIRTGEWVSGGVSSSEEEVYYRFSASWSTAVTISFKNETRLQQGIQWVVSLYDKNFEFILEKKFDMGHTRTESTLLCGINSMQPYYIKIRTEGGVKSDWPNTGYSFRIDKDNYSGWEVELNNTIERADKVHLESYQYGNLMDPEDVDYYYFKTLKAGQVELEFWLSDEYTQDGKWDVTVYNSKGTALIYKTMGEKSYDEMYSFKILPPGIYYIKIDTGNRGRKAWSDEKYSFKVICDENLNVEQEKNNSISKANPIQLSQYYNAALQTEEDIDYFAIRTEKPGYMLIQILWEENYKYSNFNFELYDGDKKYLFGRSVKPQTEKYVEFGRIGLPPGTYYLKMYASEYGQKHWSDMPYGLVVWLEKNSFCETETNNSFEKADEIKIGSTYSGSVMESTDQDYYSFKVTKRRGYALCFDNDWGSARKNCWKAALYDSSGNKMASYSYAGNECDHSELPLDLKKGTYYIKITGGKKHWSDADYRICIQNKPLPQPMKVKTKKIRIKADELKISDKKIPSRDVFVVKRAKGEVFFFKEEGSKKLRLAENGNLTVKKNTKPGEYEIRVRVAANGDEYYLPGAVFVPLRVKVVK